MYQINQKNQINLKEIAHKIELQYGEHIFNILTSGKEQRAKEFCCRNGKLTRLFDDSKNSSEIYYAKATGNDKPIIKDYRTGKSYFAINAYTEANNLSWREAVISLGKDFGLIPSDYEPAICYKNSYIPKVVITEKEQIEGCFIIKDLQFCAFEGAYLDFWAKYGIGIHLLQSCHIQPIKSYDLLNTETGTIQHKNTETAYIFEVAKGVYKVYQPFEKDKKNKWRWYTQKGCLKPNEVLFCENLLPEKCEKIFIVEGMKDALALNANFGELGLYAVGLDNASVDISQEALEHLKTNCNELILCLDNDETGEKFNKIKAKKYEVAYLPYLPTFEGAKDIADLCANFNKYDKNTVLEWLINGERVHLPTGEVIAKEPTAQATEPTAQASPQSDKEAQKEAKRLQREAEREARNKEIQASQEANREKELNKFFRVGDAYYKKVAVPNKLGTLETDFHPRQKGTIKDDFGSHAIHNIQKYEAFCLVPNHTNYKQVIDNCYNKYFELAHKPKQGDCSHSLAMVKHIFGDKYELGLDYIQLLYLKPEQCLPILGLVSKERSTGKSTFGEWLLKIFGENGRKLGNGDLASDFNEFYISKLLIVVDETAIEKKIISEAVKRMSTEKGKVIANGKSKAQYAQDFIGKFMFISNNEDNFIHIGKGENRYLVLKINKIVEDIPDMDIALENEIPAFLHYLSQRKLAHDYKGRMYFDSADLHTEQLEAVIEASKSPIERALFSLVQETFEAYNTAIELRFSLDDFFEELKDELQYITKQGIKDIIRRELLDTFEHQKSARYGYYSFSNYKIWDTEINFGSLPLPIKRNNAHYLVKVQNFLGNGEYYKRTGQDVENDKTSTKPTKIDIQTGNINSEDCPF